MADKTETVTLNQGAGSADETLTRKWIDQGDGTHAEKVAAELVIGDVTVGKVDQGAAGSEDWPVVPHGLTKNIDVTPTLSVGGSYVTGDYVGTTGAAMEFALAARANGGTGWVLGALLENNAAESIPMELWLFDAAPTPPTDSAAWSISDADAKKCIGVLTFGVETSWVLSALNGVCRSPAVAIPFTCAGDSRSLYGCLVARGSLTGAPTVRLNIAQD